MPAKPLPPPRSTGWQLRDRELLHQGIPLMMGIVNVTPDSFSDGGRYHRVERAVEHALQLADDGADILDIGGESTRPYATPVSSQDELQRVLPVIQQVARQTRVPISVDTSKSDVAIAALESGAEIVNDITGLQGDPCMLATVAHWRAGVCAMHMQGTPQTMQDQPHYTDVVAEVHDYLRQRRDAIEQAGLPRAAICLDPGIGFGKTHQQNLTLLRDVAVFHDLGCPILVGHSRKGFIAKVLGDTDIDRLPGTIGVALAMVQQGVQVLRVHDVKPVKDACRLFAAVTGAPIHFRTREKM